MAFNLQMKVFKQCFGGEVMIFHSEIIRILFHFLACNHESSIPIAAKLSAAKHTRVHLGKTARIVSMHTNQMEMACRALVSIQCDEDKST